MRSINPNLVGLFLGAFTGGVHLLWSLLVWVGWAQPLVDAVFQLHMLEPVLVVQPFDVMTAFELVVTTFAVGFIVGWIGAMAWDWLARP